jgi:two-component sensor histidine kinase
MPLRSRSLMRLGRKELWGVPLLVMTAWFMAYLSLMFDMVLLNDWSPAWVLIFVVTYGLIALLAWGYRVLILERFNINSAALNLVVAGILGAIKNLTVAPLGLYFGVLDEPLWAFRVVGGITMGAGIFMFSGLALGARTEHNALLAQLTQVQASLLALRNSSKARLREASDLLASSTRELLLPKLDDLQTLVKSRGDSNLALLNLRNLIQNEVRPLSQDLSTQATVLVEDHVKIEPVPKRYRLFRPEMELRGLIRPNSAGVSLAIGGLLLGYVILGAPRCDKILYLSVISWGMAWLAKALVPAGLKVSQRIAIWSLFVIGTAMAVPPYLIAITEIEEPNEPWLLLLIWPVSLLSLMFYAFSESLDRDRVAVRAALNAENQQLAHDQALFEQQLWLGRRAWQFVVHGTVQSALTAALTRLQSTPEPEQYVLNRVAEDLERARQALLAPPVRTIDLPDSIAQLKATWRGICDIRTNISDRAARALRSNNDACLCVNEIIKEAVSNAVRHGEAKVVNIAIDRHDDFSLEIQVSNDGVPLRAQNELGVGSRLIEELTTDWTIDSSKATGQTVFKANLPLQRG